MYKSIILQRPLSALATGAAVALLALSAAPAMARPTEKHEMITPPLVAEGENLLDCYITNVSDRDRVVLIEAVTRDGEPVASEEVVLAPDTEKVVTVPAALRARYCRFRLEGQPANYRASILVREPGRGSISALAAE